jgi:hypothetical protein
VDDGDGAVVPDLPAVLLEPVAPGLILRGEPVRLVEKIDVLDGLAPDEHEGAIDSVHLAGSELVRLGGSILGEPGRLEDVPSTTQARRASRHR